MSEPVVLYSVQSYLAYYINTNYYNKIHYAWCASSFDCETKSALSPKTAHTSNPKNIYENLMKDISTPDNHYKRPEIHRNTVGLLKGASIMLQKNVITESQYDSIRTIIKKCQKGAAVSEYFRPLVYVIPFELNKPLIKSVEIGKRALPLSDEFIIEELPKGNFDIIDIKGGRL